MLFSHRQPWIRGFGRPRTEQMPSATTCDQLAARVRRAEDLSLPDAEQAAEQRHCAARHSLLTLHRAPAAPDDLGDTPERLRSGTSDVVGSGKMEDGEARLDDPFATVRHDSPLTTSAHDPGSDRRSAPLDGPTAGGTPVRRQTGRPGGKHDGLRPIADFELLQHPRDMGLDRGVADGQLPCSDRREAVPARER